MELGLAIGLEKPFILVKDKGAEPAGLIRDIEYYPINNYLDVKTELGSLLEGQIVSIKQYQFPQSSFQEEDQNKNALIYHGENENIDITVTLAQQLKKCGFSPVILGNFNQKLAKYLQSEVKIKPRFIQSREEIVNTIRKSQFSVFNVAKTASTDNFVAMGIAIGLNKPFFPILHRPTNMPSDLMYLTPIKYSSGTELKEVFELYFDQWHEDIFDRM